jgi:hypothetical protein
LGRPLAGQPARGRSCEQIGTLPYLIVDARLVGVLANRAKRTVRGALGLGFLRLLFVGGDLRPVVEHPNVEQLRFGLAAQQVLVDAFVVHDRWVGAEVYQATTS